MSASFDRGIERSKALETALLNAGTKMYQVPNTNEARTFFAETSSKYGRRLEFSEVPLSDFADVSPDLLKAKVTELVLRGYARGAYWSQLCYVHNMIEASETIYLTNRRNYKVVTGFGNAESPGLVRNAKRYQVRLHGVTESAEKRMRLDIDRRDLLPEHIGDLERELIASGEAFAKNVRDDIIVAYIANRTTQQALGVDTRYKAIMTLGAKLAKVSGGMSAIIIDHDDFVEAMTEQTSAGSTPFAKSLVPASNVGLPFDSSQNKYDGLVGWLDGKVPVYVASDTSASLNGTILGVAVDESLAIGVHKGFTIEGDFGSLHELYKTKISMRYDLQPANGAGIGYVSGA